MDADAPEKINISLAGEIEGNASTIVEVVFVTDVITPNSCALRSLYFLVRKLGTHAKSTDKHFKFRVSEAWDDLLKRIRPF
ncbi:uncharacterized protein PHALS_07597 [Plasmopara halstedii]|uniref:Uncharacterized protein n=1 Tax=Plasmopara halstedii TaxID=4781 RepID=A0A0P1B670_PLAHL|nr:uncharacterized protein PHALS_07597 [Plasmopara halstedii]CEG49856.1 hypothetical protein PHALS_07597 [Plasmopara halstedii]|eukprot:XP_024586225.1 hypothetical protein PHALS_07597 [Plasmopara halstedii]